jgi:hypothetical protein
MQNFIIATHKFLVAVLQDSWRAATWLWILSNFLKIWNHVPRSKEEITGGEHSLHACRESRGTKHKTAIYVHKIGAADLCSLSHWCANRWVVIYAITSASMMSLHGWLVDGSPSIAIWGLRWIGSENCGTFISRARYGFYAWNLFRTQRLWRWQHAVILHTESHIAGKNRTWQGTKVSEVIVLQVQGLKSCSFHVAYKVLQCNPSIPNWKKTCKWT